MSCFEEVCHLYLPGLSCTEAPGLSFVVRCVKHVSHAWGPGDWLRSSAIQRCSGRSSGMGVLCGYRSPKNLSPGSKITPLTPGKSLYSKLFLFYILRLSCYQQCGFPASWPGRDQRCLFFLRPLHSCISFARGVQDSHCSFKFVEFWELTHSRLPRGQKSYTVSYLSSPNPRAV